MTFQRFTSVVVLFAASLLVGNANAVPVTDPHDIDDATDVVYSYFTITARGGIELTATRDSGSSVDPFLYLFHDTGAGMLSSNDYIARNDDGAGFPNSQITRLLGQGDYIAAVGNFYLSLNEAINGYNGGLNSGGTGGVTVGLNGATGWMLNTNDRWRYVRSGGDGHFNAVPEPAGIALFGIGLIAAVGVARRRRKSA